MFRRCSKQKLKDLPRYDGVLDRFYCSQKQAEENWKECHDKGSEGVVLPGVSDIFVLGGSWI